MGNFIVWVNQGKNSVTIWSIFTSRKMWATDITCFWYDAIKVQSINYDMFSLKQLSLYLPKSIDLTIGHSVSNGTWSAQGYLRGHPACEWFYRANNPVFLSKEWLRKKGRGSYRLKEDEVIFQPILCMVRVWILIRTKQI